MTTDIRLETPETAGLLKGQLQARHLDELGTDAGEQRIAGAAGTANDSHTALMSKNRATRIRNRFRLRFFARPGQSRLAANRPKSNIIVGIPDEFDTFVSSSETGGRRFANEFLHRGAVNSLTGMALSLLLDVDLAL